MLAFSLHGGESTRYVDVAHRVLCALFGVFWLVPVYILSFPLSCVWCEAPSENHALEECEEGKEDKEEKWTKKRRRRTGFKYDEEDNEPIYSSKEHT